MLFVERRAQSLQFKLALYVRRPFHALRDLGGEALRLSYDPARRIKQLAVRALEPL
jgi:hypothetical protein